MRILGVSIENFRGISCGEVRFHAPHVLLVGSNNAGKSTILEALDLALNPDRLRGREAVDEHDFFQGRYLPQEHHEELPRIKICVTLGSLSAEEQRDFRRHLEAWNVNEFRPFTSEELDARTPQQQDFVLQVGFEAAYDQEEDEFAASSFFIVPEGPGGEREACGRRPKQAIGFLYLRGLRTARRAASLQRGSLLDLLLREGASGAQMWQTLLDKVASAADGIAESDELSGALGNIRRRVDSLIPLSDSQPGSRLHVGRLTRRHLRETMTYFLSSRESDHMLPFDRLGSGVANVLVFALLSAIAEARSNVIFAMEEPEIALAPHTQRLMVKRLRQQAAQSILTSHSPYVAERFLPDMLVVVRRVGEGRLQPHPVELEHNVKAKTLRQEFRGRFAEGLFAKAVVIVEGITELWAIPSAVEQLTQVSETGLTSFDLEGLVFIPSDGEGDLDKFAGYFESLGIEAHVVCDALSTNRLEEIRSAATSVYSHDYRGFEALIAQELPLSAVKRVIKECRGWDRAPRMAYPTEEDIEATWRKCLLSVLKSRKGEGWAARVLALCEATELPPSLFRIVAHLRRNMRLDPLRHDDPLAELFRSADEMSVEPPPQQDGGT